MISRIATVVALALWSSARAAAQEAAAPEAAAAAEATPARLDVRVYADADVATSDGLGEPSRFALGQTDLFMTSRLSDRFFGLGEIVFESGDDNAIAVDVERLLLTYRFGDALTLGIGRYHTAIGFYNTAYHHGTWFQTATGRPELFAFEDDSGVLPIHNVGLTASGEIPSGRVNLRYVVEVGNGRSWADGSEPVQNVRDQNGRKAVNVGLLARPAAAPGLELGVSLYDDRLGAGPGGQMKVDETIWAAHAVYQTFETEILCEVVGLRHSASGGGNTTDSLGFYGQASHAWGPWRPYVRYQYLDVPSGDPVLPAGNQKGPSLGLRYDFAEHVALKAQYDRFRLSGRGTSNKGTLQAAFSF